MYVPPTDPRDRSPTNRPSWRTVLAVAASPIAVVAFLVTISTPVAGSALVVAIAGVVVAGRRTVRLVRCARECQSFAVDLVGDVRITVSKNATGTDPRNGGESESTRRTSCC